MTSGQFIPVTSDGTHPSIKQNRIRHCYNTTAELCRLHHRFGHLHTCKLSLLRKADPDKVTEGICRTLKNITHSL